MTLDAALRDDAVTTRMLRVLECAARALTLCCCATWRRPTPSFDYSRDALLLMFTFYAICEY